MSTGYSWEGIRQVRATLLGARHVPERLCGGYVYLGALSSVRPLPLPLPNKTTVLYCACYESTWDLACCLVYHHLHGW